MGKCANPMALYLGCLNKKIIFYIPKKAKSASSQQTPYNMSSDLVKNIDQNAASVALAIAPPVSKVAQVKTKRGQVINIPEFQVPSNNPNGIIPTDWFFNAVGNFQTAIANATQQTIKIDRGAGSGKTVGRVWLRVTLQNTDASNDVQMAPMPFWFSSIQFQTPGGDIIHTDSSLGLFFKLLTCTSLEEFSSMSDLVCMTNDYNAGPLLLRSSTQEYDLPLFGNAFSCGEIPTRVLQGDSQCVIQFAPTANSVISAADTSLIQINALSLIFEMQNLDSMLIAELDNEYHRFEHSFIYPFQRAMSWSQTFNASTQYSFQLSGITGDGVCAFVGLRAGNTGSSQYYFVPITSYQFQDSAGLPITGSNFVTGDFGRWGHAPRWSLGSWMQDRRINIWNFSSKNSGILEFLTMGRKSGAYGFSGNESLVINTPGAGTSEIWTLATGDATAPTGGSYQLQWVDEWGYSETTTPLAYNASASAIKAALELLPNFEGTVTVSAALSATGSLTITFGGVYANRPMRGRNYYLNVFPALYNATIGQGVTASVTTAGVLGMTSGATHYLDVIMYTSSILSISSDKQQSGWGRMRIQNA